MNPLNPAIFLLGTLLSGQSDPFVLSPEAQNWARRAVLQHPGTKQKLQGILDAVFSPPVEGGLGLGMVYDNSRTRTVEEVWKERRANCLSLTAFFVAACRAAGIDAKYAEPMNTNRWHRIGNLVRLERHVVAVARAPPSTTWWPTSFRSCAGGSGSTSSPSILRPGSRRCSTATGRWEPGRWSEGGRPGAGEAVGRRRRRLRGRLERAGRGPPGARAGGGGRGQLPEGDGPGPEGRHPGRQPGAVPAGAGAPEEAQALRTLGAELRKRDPFFHSFLCDEAMESGKVDEAQKEIKLALKLQPYKPEFHLAQARIHLQRGREEAAVKSLKEARRWSIPKERNRYDAKLAALGR